MDATDLPSGTVYPILRRIEEEGLVRARWERFLGQPPGVHLKTKVDGMAMIIPLFEQAGSLEQGGKVRDAQIDAVFEKWVERAPMEAAARR